MTFHSGRRLLFLSVVAGGIGCGGVRRTGTAPGAVIGEKPVSHVELTIHNLTQDQAEKVKEQLGRQDLDHVVLKQFAGGNAVYELDVEGCECDVPAKVAQLSQLGFKYEGRVTKMAFSAFDNTPPTVTFVTPGAGKVLTESAQGITVEVPDADVVSVTVNGTPASRFKGNLFRAQLSLKDGVNDLVVIAKDKTGNEGRAQIRVAVDTTPPALAATVKVVVEGQVDPGATVMIEGKEASVESNGHYKAEVPVRKGQKEVEIIAIDKSGNKTKTTKDIGN